MKLWGSGSRLGAVREKWEMNMIKIQCRNVRNSQRFNKNNMFFNAKSIFQQIRKPGRDK